MTKVLISLFWSVSFFTFVCLWGNSVGTATERRRRYTGLGNKDRLMKTLAPKMSQNNHLQIDHYKVKHFLACCLSHGLISLGKRKRHCLCFSFYCCDNTLQSNLPFLLSNFFKPPLILLIPYSKELKHVNDFNPTLVGSRAILIDREFIGNETDFVR